MSLRLRAVLIAGLSLMVLWGLAAGWMMRGVQGNLDRTLDGRLAMSARMVAGLLERSALGADAASQDFNEGVRVTGKEGIACEIRLLQGEVLARTSTGSPSIFHDLPPGLSTREIDGHAWRVYVLRTAGGYQVSTADRLDNRDRLIGEMLCAAGVPFLIAVLGGLVALWIGIGRGLQPLDALCAQLRERQANDTMAIAIRRPPRELRPVLEAMNGLLGRLTQVIAGQRAFTDAAAHELRTPLTVIDTHLQIIRDADVDEARKSLGSAEEGVRRLTRTLDQMMILARTEAPVIMEDRCESVMSVLAGVLGRLDGRERGRVQVSTDGVDLGSIVGASMLGTVLRNLLDNALRYSPEGSPVQVRIDSDDGRCTLTVADRGPGLSADSVARMGQRFWRADQGRRRNDGSGLGISIVQAIAARFEGELEFRAREGGGLLVSFSSRVASAQG